MLEDFLGASGVKLLVNFLFTGIGALIGYFTAYAYPTEKNFKKLGLNSKSHFW